VSAAACLRRLRVMRVLWVVGIVLLTGCSRIDLYTNLSEQQANEVAAVLLAAEIDVDKRLSDSKAWSVRIDKPDLPRAMDVLETAGVPKAAGLSMVDVFKKDGFISSPLEERARFISATAKELEQTIARMNGVLDARVHLAMPERDPLTDAIIPPSASVYVKYGQSVKFAESGGVADVKAIVRDAVEGLAADRITVVAAPTLGSWRQGVRPSTNVLATYEYQRPLISTQAWMGIAAVLSGILLLAVWWWRSRWLGWLLPRRGRTAGGTRGAG
jgi:type III secretion protein J